MRQVYLFLLIVVVILGASFFFYPKAECGFNSVIMPFEKYRCSCLGFVGRDTRQSSVDDGRISYVCFGIKTGKTRLVSENFKILSDMVCSGKHLCIYPTEITLEKGEDETSIISIQDDNSTISYKLLVVKGDGYDENQNIIENTLDFSYDQGIINLKSKDRKTVSLDIHSSKETKVGIYTLRLTLVNNNNETRGQEMLYVHVN